MLWFATTTLEKLQAVPPRFWVNVLLTAATVVVVAVVVRYAAQMNKLVLSLIVFLLFSVVSFQWVYERNEPRFMTPYVEQVAPFFPGKIEYRN